MDGNLVYRYGNGQNEQRQHIDINIANNKWAYLTSFTNSSFGDLRQGNKDHQPTQILVKDFFM